MSIWAYLFPSQSWTERFFVLEHFSVLKGRFCCLGSAAVHVLGVFLIFGMFLLLQSFDKGHVFAAPYTFVVGVDHPHYYLFDPLVRQPTEALADVIAPNGLYPHLLSSPVDLEPERSSWAVARAAAFFFDHTPFRIHPSCRSAFLLD